jgi:hypothetical protein
VPVREALACDAAVFQARRRRRPDLAEAWLADIPPASSSEWLRSRAEAAILEARGDVPGALAKLGAHTRALASLPDRSQRQFLEKVAARWRSELAEGWIPTA